MTAPASDSANALRLAGVATLLALGAIAFTLFGGAGGDAVAPASDSPDNTRIEAAMARLTARVEALERRPATSGSLDAIGNGAEPGQVLSEPKATEPQASRVSAIPIEQLAARVDRLEVEVAATREKPEGFAKPDAVPATLAVLLASRGVVVGVADIEAIMQHADVLADLVRDGAAAEWHRLEAYRGLLIFDQAEHATATVQDVAGLLWAKDKKVRLTAASLLTNCMHPGLSDVLTRAYYREADTEVRGAIVARLVQCIDSPLGRATLEAAAKTEADADIRARIARALAR